MRNEASVEASPGPTREQSSCLRGARPREGGPDDPILAIRLAGLDLPNCVGLAAGFEFVDPDLFVGSFEAVFVASTQLS